MKNLEKYYINFDELKVGDTVWYIRKGNIKITNIDINDMYAIELYDTYDSFDKNGFYDTDDKYPSIYKSNPFLDLKEELRMIEVLEIDMWKERELIKIIDKRAIYFSQNKNFVYETLSWREIQPKELTEKEEIEALKERVKYLEIYTKDIWK